MAGDAIFASERYGYLQEIEALREGAAKADKLCKENASLREELESSKEKLAESQRDYAKVACARNVLEMKVRQYKDTTKHWRAYVKEWILKHPIKQLRLLDRDTGREQRSSSAPSPPPFPAGITPALSEFSRSISPQQDGLMGSNPQQVRESTGKNAQGAEVWNSSNPPKEYDFINPVPKKVLTDKIIATQAALDDNSMIDISDVTEEFNQSQDRPEALTALRRPGDRVSDQCIQVKDGSSPPVIVSERSLKRKRSIRREDTDIHVPEGCRNLGESVSRPLSVKDEQTSSSPIPTHSSLQKTHDSLDLDDLGDQLGTPRKRHHLERMRLRYSGRAASTVVQDDERIADTTGDGDFQNLHDDSVEIKGEDCRDIGHLRPVHDAVLPEATVIDSTVVEPDEKQQQTRTKLSKAQRQAHNDRVSKRLGAVERVPCGKFHSGTSIISTRSQGNNSSLGRPRSPATLSTSDDVQPRTPQDHRGNEERKEHLEISTILCPTDANANALPRTSEYPANPKPSCPPSRRDRGAAHIPSLAEDGANLMSIRNAQDAKVPDAYNRLGALLSVPSTAKLPIKSIIPNTMPSHDLGDRETPTSHLKRHQKVQGPTTPTSMPIKTLKADIGRASKSAQPTTKSSTPQPFLRKPPLPDQTPDAQPENKPIRARPLRRLRLDDFKLNPTYSDYAYHESVRKHDEKKSLSSCTDPTCPRCKDIRKFVEQSGYATTPKLGLFDSSSGGGKDADQRLLEECLGGDHRRLQRMSADERERLLMAAKTKHFADHFGKHKQAYGRAKSPAGYWEVGMPTTQENEKNQEAAWIMERQTTEERYLEALKPNGRYLFADE